MPDPVEGVLDRGTLDELLDSVGGDAEFLAELIDAYGVDAPLQIEALRTALAAGEVEGLVRPAHTLKSSSASLAALNLAEQCRRLEASAKAGVLEGSADAIEAITAELARVLAALEAAKWSAAV